MKPPSILSCLSNQCMLTPTDEEAASIPSPEEVFPPEFSNTRQMKFDTLSLQGGFTILKGRINASDILGISNSDLVPGKYEGGFKLWECAVDLVDTLRREIQDGQLSFRGKRVLEIGCGHGLPGILACIKGASVVHFQDFNAEVLRCLTFPNVNANLEYAQARLLQPNAGALTPTRSLTISPEVQYFAGDWENVDTLLSTVEQTSEDTPPSVQNEEVDTETRLRTRKKSGSRACESRREDYTGEYAGGYDVILMSETVYAVSSFPKLYSLMKKCLRPYYGVAYVAGKKHYFGVGGGTRQFKHLVEDHGEFGAHLVAEFADGSSNVREIWKFFFKQ